jgi:hypothetical protein
MVLFSLYNNLFIYCAMIFSNNEALDGNNELMISNRWEGNAGEGERRKGKTKEASARFPNQYGGRPGGSTFS